MTTYTLNHLVNIEVLQEIQERFAAAIGLGVIIANEHGEPITAPSNFTDFCSKMRSSKEGLQCCILSDQNLGIQAAQQGKSVVHHCHAGLIDLAAPIILNGKHLGSVLCGQVLIAPQDKKQLHYMREKFKQLPIDQELLELYLEEIEFANQKQIDSTLQMLQLIADYIAKISSNSIVEEELNEKREKLMKELEEHVELKSLLQEMQLKVLQYQQRPVMSPFKSQGFCSHPEIVTIIEYIKDNLHLDLKLDYLAALVHFNGQYLSRLFKQETTYTLTQYITACRIEKAKHYLSYSSEYTVVEISRKCGIADSNYFARVFKKYEGISPSQYQQQAHLNRKKRMNSFNNFLM